MYITYNGIDYSCQCRPSTTMTYRGLPADFPAPVDGNITLCADDGFVLRTDNSAGYLRQTFEAGTLVLTNASQPVGTVGQLASLRNSLNKKFWDRFQQKGHRTNYDYAFSNECAKVESKECAATSLNVWSWADFRPVYDIKPKSANHMFALVGNGSFDLVARLAEQGVSLDFSECEDFTHMLKYAGIKNIGVIDATSAPHINYLFQYAVTLKTVEKLIVRKEHTFAGAFSYCKALEAITIEGTIGHTVHLERGPKDKTTNKYAPILLNKASIISFMNALDPNVQAGQSITFSLKAIQDAFGVEDPEMSDEWCSLVNRASNWTILLYE